MREARAIRAARLGLAALLVVLPLAACGGTDREGSDESATITVLAASSLTGTFTALAERFEAEHPGVRVRLAFDSSAALAQQALDGAPADLLATADVATMQAAADAQGSNPQVFATNTMVLVTPADNPAQLASFADLDTGDVDYVMCVPEAPCGAVAQALLRHADITARAVSLEVDVKAVLAKVTSDEADAGLVYATDAAAAGDDVRRFEIPDAARETTSYPIARLTQSGNPSLAQQFIELLRSADGQQLLTAAGFGPP